MKNAVLSGLPKVEEVVKNGFEKNVLNKLSADDVLAMKIHGFTPEMVGKFKFMGFDDISQDEFQRLQIHDIGPEF